MSDPYNKTAVHFDKTRIPPILKQFLHPSPQTLADLGCGDGPWFDLLFRNGYISYQKPVYAVDLEELRLERIQRRFPSIITLEAPADNVPQIESGSLDWIFSTMVMEHVPDERRYLKEIARILRPGGKAYITTVFKHTWAWYFRKRDGETVLDTSHLREYTDLEKFRALITEQGGMEILAIQLIPMWFPLLDPILFRLSRYVSLQKRTMTLLRYFQVPIPGYFELHLIISPRATG